MSDLSPALSAALDRLIAAHDGDLALLYLYILRRGRFEAEAAARELCRTRGEIDAAEEKLRRLGLFPDGGSPLPAPDRPALPEEERPELTARDVAQLAEDDPNVTQFFAEAERVFGRKLSSADLRTLCGVYAGLPLPAEVLYLLLHYCAEEAAARRQRLTARAVEKEALRWNELEVLTLEMAEEHIRRERARKDAVQRVLPALGIREREPVPSERRHILEWLEMGFGEDAIALAYDRTVTAIQKFNWNYADKILRRWHEKGLHTLREIESGDGRGRRGSGGSGVGVGSGASAGDYDFPKKL